MSDRLIEVTRLIFSFTGFLNASVCSKDGGIHDDRLYSRDVDPAKADERIYDEVKDGHEDKNQQGIQHLDDREGRSLPLNDSIKDHLPP